MRLQVCIEKDDSGYFVVEVPAFPGCFSQGKTPSQAKRNIKIAIPAWIRTMESKHSNKLSRKYEVSV